MSRSLGIFSGTLDTEAKQEVIRMLEKILPEKIDNNFPGHKLSQYAFVALIIITVFRSLAHMFLPDGGAESIATIDLSVEGADIIVGMFAQWGLSQLLMAGLYIVVYLKYKSMIPLMYVIIFFEYAGRIAMGLLKPIETVGTAPGALGNLIIVPLAIILFFFAIRNPNQQSNSHKSDSSTAEPRVQ